MIQVFVPQPLCRLISLFQKTEEFLHTSVRIAGQPACPAHRVKTPPPSAITELASLRHMTDFASLVRIPLIDRVVNDHRASHTIAQTDIECILELPVGPGLPVSRRIGIMDQSVAVRNIRCDLFPLLLREIQRHTVRNLTPVIRDQALYRYPHSEQVLIHNIRILLHTFHDFPDLPKICVVLQIKIAPPSLHADNVARPP